MSAKRARQRDRRPVLPVTESDEVAGRRARKSSRFSDGAPAPLLLLFGIAALEKSLVAGPGGSWRELPLGPAVLCLRQRPLAEAGGNRTHRSEG
jgi:hypothetical protein